MKKKGIGVTLGIMCFVLVYGLLVQIRTVEKSDSAALKTYTEDQLRTEVLKWKDKYDDAYQKSEDNEKLLEEYRNATAESGDSNNIIKEELNKANSALGLNSVKGNGIILTLDDTDTAIVSEPISDTELLKVVNELKAAGAEAISINEQRIITTSEIRAINLREMVVNSESIVSPYTIKAIGNPETLGSSLKIKSGMVDTLRQYGIVTDIQVLDEVNIPKYNGVIQFEYAEVVQ